MKKLLLTLIGVLSGIIVFAQKSGEVSGTVLDEKSSALPFTTVMLLKASDSTLAKAVVSDSEGAFKIENAVFNHYFLKISMVGYEDFYSPKFYLNEQNGSFKLEPIKMAVQTNALKELSVTAKKPFIEQQIDKTVLNVENSIVASGSTALEVLEKAPGVVVDQQNESIKLKNKSGVMFMIDGKKNYLSEADLVQYLKNMSSDQIASIEIITNPSSKYDASGNSGIINIKLKKNQNYGTNGSFSSTLGTAFVPNSTGDLNRGSVNLNLNYRNKKWNLFGSTSGNRGSWYNENRLHRNVYYENTKSVFDQFSQRNGHGLGNSTKIGADYFLNKKTTIGVMADINLWDGEMVGTGNTTIASTTGAETINSSLKQIIGMEMGRTNINSNFNIKHNINDKGQELTFDIDYSNFRNTDNQNFNTSYFDQKGNTTSTLFQQSHTPKYINIVAAKIDYVLPLKNQTKLEIGAKSGYVKTDNDFGFEYLQDAQWINDAGKSNHFIYEENINAAYVNLGKNWKKWGVQGGLRAEHTHSVGNSLTMNKVVPRDYLSLFPTMFINQNINKNNSMRYSYSRRIDRPNYEQLNPFLFFLDPYTYEEGNPFLQPQFTDNFELNYTYKDSYSVGLGYSKTRDMMTQITEQNDTTRVTYAIQRNLQQFENYSMNLSFPVTVRKWWIMQNNFSLYFGKFLDENLLGGRLDAGQLAYNFYTSSTFTLPKNWSAEFNMWYNSPSLGGIFTGTKPQYAINGGIQKSIFNKKGRIKLSGNDLFMTSFWNGAVKYQNMDFTIKNRWTSRRVSLTFSYNFGNQNVKNARNRKTANDDLKNRAGGNQG